MGFLHGHQGQPQVILAEAHSRHSRLYGNGVDLGEEGVNEAVVTALHLCRARNITAKEVI